MIKCAVWCQKCCAKCQPRLKAEVLPATVQESAPIVMVLLPGRFAKRMRRQTDRRHAYILLDSPSYVAFTPFDFDANAFVGDVLSYARAQPEHIEAVIAFDCFPTLLASIVATELGLPGPSFRSVFTCISKYYMRRAFDPEMEVVTPPNQPGRFPAFLKLCDTQFMMGTRRCLDAADLKRQWRD
eukprot:4262135-Prymnesium_polylepis.1